MSRLLHILSTLAITDVVFTILMRISVVELLLLERVGCLLYEPYSVYVDVCFIIAIGNDIALVDAGLHFICI